MGEAVVALIGVAATFLSWWMERSKNDPLKHQIKQAQLNNKRLLDKLARSVGRVKTLERLVLKYKKEAYGKMDTDDIIDAWNNGLWDDHEDPEDSN